MATETVALTIVGLAAIKKLAEEIAIDVYKAGKRELSHAVARDKAIAAADGIASRINDYRLVKTLIEPERPTDLYSFYHPPLVEHSGWNQAPCRAESVDTLSRSRRTHCVAVVGTVGQGKSILLRYLATQELSRGRVPVLVELRNAAPNTIFDAVREELISLGFVDITKAATRKLLTDGRLSVFLDGLDEVAPARIRHETVKEIEAFSRRYKRTRLVVSSRPGTGLEHCREFEVTRLSPLPFDDVPKLVAKFADEEIAERLIALIQRESYGELPQLLTTPLLVALLVVRFRIEQTVPRTHSEFYRDLFDLLVVRHDSLKPAFKRRRLSSLSDTSLKEFFATFCYITRAARLAADRDDLPNQRRDEALRAAIEAGTPAGLTAQTSELALADVVTISCLLAEEGGIYSFIHRSVQEYHSASFIAGRDDSVVSEFYRLLREDGWRDWGQELAFLMQLDPPRFWQHFGIPTLEDLTRLPSIGERDEHLDQWIVANFGDDYVEVPKYPESHPGIAAYAHGAEYRNFWLLGFDTPGRRRLDTLQAVNRAACALFPDETNEPSKISVKAVQALVASIGVEKVRESAAFWSFSVGAHYPTLPSKFRGALRSSYGQIYSQLQERLAGGRLIVATANKRGSLLTLALRGKT